MGRQMWAGARKEQLPGAVDFIQDADDGWQDERLQWWTRHHDLHEWLHEVYKKKGGTEGFDNWNSVALSLEDINELERFIQSGGFPLPRPVDPPQYCLGRQTYTDEDRERDLEFVAKARAAFERGHAVYYTWW